MNIKRNKNVTKLIVGQPSILVFVIPLEEQVNLILRWHYSKQLHQSMEELLLCNAAPAHSIENPKRVKQIEVSVRN